MLEHHFIHPSDGPNMLTFDMFKEVMRETKARYVH